MRGTRVVGSRNDGVPSQIFTGDTARMKAERVAELQEMTADDGIPREMVGGETTRIDQTALTGLIEKSEGVAQGTPKLGMPQLAEEPEIQILARGSSQEVEVPVVEEVVVVEAAPVEVIVREPSLPIAPQSRTRDVVIGALLALLVMAAWFCATQL